MPVFLLEKVVYRLSLLSMNSILIFTLWNSGLFEDKTHFGGIGKQNGFFLTRPFVFLPLWGVGGPLDLPLPAPGGYDLKNGWQSLQTSESEKCYGSPFMVLVLVVVRGVYLRLLLTGVLVRAGRLHHVQPGTLCWPLHPRLAHRWQPVLQVGVLKQSIDWEFSIVLF